MRCEKPLGHGDTIQGLWSAARAQRLPHALIFSGPEGVGKFLAAQWFVFGLFCEHGPGEPCGVCGPCKRLAAGTHPDVYVLDPLAMELETILVKHIAPRAGESGPNLLDWFSLRPMEGGYRIAIVREAERMNHQAQNALLKTLEEPGEQALLVLETKSPDSLLGTVRSRCSAVAFERLSLEATGELLAREGLAGEEAARYAAWSQGAPGAALRLHARGAGQLVDLCGRTLDGSLDPLLAAAEVAQAKGDFGGGTARQVARERARTFLDLALGVLTDLGRAAAGVAPDALAHGELVASLACDHRRRNAMLEATLQARQDIEANLAPDAVLEELLLSFAPATTSAGPAGGRR